MSAATAVAAAPLAGVAVRAAGDTLPLRIAVDRLRALGCAVEREDGTRTGDGDRAERDGGAGWAAPSGHGGARSVRGVPSADEHRARRGGDAGRIDVVGSGGAGCDISWSADGAALADERDVQAACGLAHLHGRARGRPRFLPVDHASVCAGVLAAQAVAAVVLALERGGPALRASVSVAGAALLAVAPYAAEATADPGGVPGPGPGEPPPFRSADGVRFEIETLDPEAWLRFWEALGAPREAVAAGWAPFQRRFATAVCPLPGELFAVLETLPFAAAAETARACGVGAVALRAPGDAAEEDPEPPWRLHGTG
ncbi:CoA transferase, partial [Nocardiopsis sp. CC223A]|uniref:CoA transferase n=1 Tax=Nocardiopsis sp. CC223A TaxID=3044051 RepID=UPI002796192E